MTSPLSSRTLWCPRLGLQGTWMWHWMTRCHSLLTTLWQPAPADSSSTTSGGKVRSSPRKWRRFWSRLLLSHTLTTVTRFWLVCLHVPSDHCSTSRMQQPSGLQPTQVLPHHTATALPGYWWLRTVLQMVLAHPTYRTWSNHTPQPVH